MWWPDKIVWEDVQEKFELLELLLLVVFWNKHSDWLFLVKGFLLLVCEVSDMRSDTIITLIGSVKNVGMLCYQYYPQKMLITRRHSSNTHLDWTGPGPQVKYVVVVDYQIIVCSFVLSFVIEFEQIEAFDSLWYKRRRLLNFVQSRTCTDWFWL